MESPSPQCTAGPAQRLLVIMPGREAPAFLACSTRCGHPGHSTRGHRVSSTDSAGGSSADYRRNGGLRGRQDGMDFLPTDDGRTELREEGAAAHGEREGQRSDDMDTWRQEESTRESGRSTAGLGIRRRLSQACSNVSSFWSGKGTVTRDGWLSALQLAGMSHAFFC